MGMHKAVTKYDGMKVRQTGGQSTKSKAAVGAKNRGTNSISGSVKISQGGESEGSGIAAGKSKATSQQRIKNGSQNFRG